MIDAESGQSVGWTTIVIEGLERARMSDAEGYFFFANVPPGTHVLQILHVGYHEARFEVEVVAGDTTHVDLAIGHESLQVEGLLIEGERRSSVFSTASTRSCLQRQQAAAEFRAAPLPRPSPTSRGIAQRSMGPAPARPVLRRAGRRPLAGGRRRRAHRRFCLVLPRITPWPLSR